MRNRELVLFVVIALILAEAAWRVYVRRSGYDWQSAATSFGIAIGHFVSGVANTAIVSAGLMAAWKLTPLHLPVTDWRTWACGFFAVEFAYYWHHRWSHTVRWLWATHAVHHSAQQLTLPAAIRLGWTNALSGGWLVFAPLVLLGWHPAVIAGLLAMNLSYQFFLHTEAIGRLGVLELFLNTPSHHRVHHASNDCYIDKNFGGVLIVFDRWFGTFAAERAGELIRYGLAQPIDSNNPFKLALNEWGLMARDIMNARSLTAAWHAAFGRP